MKYDVNYVVCFLNLSRTVLSKMSLRSYHSCLGSQWLEWLLSVFIDEERLNIIILTPIF